MNKSLMVIAVLLVLVLPLLEACGGAYDEPEVIDRPPCVQCGPKERPSA